MSAAQAVPHRLTLPYPYDHPLLGPATWSRLAEPNDPAAGMLVAALGPGGALAWLLEEAAGPDGEVRPAPPPPVPVPAGWRGGAGAWVRQWARAAARWLPRVAGTDLRRELDTLARLGGTLLVPGEPGWPEGLADLDCPPFCLWVRGDAGLVGRCAGGQGTRSVAVVGSRAATTYGSRVSERMGLELSATGVLVVSGGAYGIDAAVHRGALRGGTTVSVSAGGVDRLYPAGNARLLQEVIDHGALVAEVPPGCQPGRHRFLSRNRVIAALTHGTVVVEAAWRSGALSTARHAADLGRHLGAVPGPVTSPESAGCHRLLREGAVCVCDAAEVVELIGAVGASDPDAVKEERSAGEKTGLLDGLSRECAAVLDAMPARASATVPSLARSAGLSERQVSASLGLLELEGRVVREAGSWRRRRA